MENLGCCHRLISGTIASGDKNVASTEKSRCVEKSRGFRTARRMPTVGRGIINLRPAGPKAKGDQNAAIVQQRGGVADEACVDHAPRQLPRAG